MLPTCTAEIVFLPLPTLGKPSEPRWPGNPPSNHYMAIIRSAAIGSARGSLGIITYRTVRGRTIGSQKRGGVDPATRADGDTLTQFIFGLMARYASARAADIQNSFSPTKYGSARNAFMKLNYEGFKAALEPLYQTGMKVSMITNEQLDNAVHEYAASNPMVIYRAKIDGEPAVYLTGVWDSALSVGTVTAVSIGGVTLADGVRIGSNTAKVGASVRATLSGFENVTLIDDGMFLELTESGESNDTVININGASVSESNGNFIVTGTLATALPQETFSSFRVCVRHSEGIGELSNKVYSNVEVYYESPI